MVSSKKGLAVFLSRLRVFTSPSVKLEQYPTDSEVAAEVLWSAYLKGDIEGKTIADLGCGTGILGIGCMALGAKKAYFADIDEQALIVLKENLAGIEGDYEILSMDVSEFREKADTVVMNPPFGVKREHADRAFLLAAYSCAKVIYSFHMHESRSFVERFSQDNGFSVTDYFDISLPLKRTYAYHTKKIQRIRVACFRLEKNI